MDTLELGVVPRTGIERDPRAKTWATEVEASVDTLELGVVPRTGIERDPRAKSWATELEASVAITTCVPRPSLDFVEAGSAPLPTLKGRSEKTKKSWLGVVGFHRSHSPLFVST